MTMSFVIPVRIRCRNQSCKYSWIPRTPAPKKCPKCQRWLDKETKKNG